MKDHFLTLIFLIMTFSLSGQESKSVAEFDPAFVHSVYFWLNNPDNEADRAVFEKAIFTLLDSSRYTKTNFLGIPPKSKRGVVDDTFTYNLFVTFESAEAQEAYQVEEAHLAFIQEAQSLWKKVVVYDAQGKLK